MQNIINFFYHHTFICLIWLMILSTLIYIQYWFYTIGVTKKINCYEAIILINNNSIVIDLRSNIEYCNGHIINSINICPDDIKQTMFTNISKNQSVIIISNKFFSKTIVNTLNKIGFKKIYLLKSGISSWKECGLPLVKNNIY
ncbi:MAG: rhodanese-like domain-containing protein [Candidatus Lightella neohaematopini]|nr:rhodanese-like domain-containing protein [Candidatus Lightella neohaematopini]